MLTRLLAHVRGHWIGALALFLVLTGGLAAAKTVLSEDRIDGEARSADVYSLSGRDIDGTVCVTTAGRAHRSRRLLPDRPWHRRNRLRDDGDQLTASSAARY